MRLYSDPLTWKVHSVSTVSTRYSKLTHEEIVRETRIERQDTFQVRDMFGRQRDVKSFQVLFELFNFTTAENRKDVGGRGPSA